MGFVLYFGAAGLTAAERREQVEGDDRGRCFWAFWLLDLGLVMISEFHGLFPNANMNERRGP